MAEEATSGVRDDRNVCQLCGAFENLSLCSGCRETWYCCKDHQVEDWKQHKRKCKGRRYKGKQQQKAGEAEKPGASEDGGSAGINGQQKAVTKQSPACASSRISQENSNSQNSDKSKTDVQLDEVDVATEWSVAEQLKETTVNDLDPKETDSSLKKSGGKSSPKQVKARVNTKQAPVQLQKIDGDKNDKNCGGASRRMTSGQLPRAAEEGSDERFFLDAKSFSQTLQLSKHTDRARRSASAMSPQGASLDSQDAYLDVLRHRFAAMARYVADCLKKYDVCVIDGFLGEATGQEILSEVKRLQEIGVMRQGQLVQSTTSSSGNIRGDIIAWIDGRGQYCENIQFLVSCMDAVVQTCSSLIEGYTINERTKVMYYSTNVFVLHRTYSLHDCWDWKWNTVCIIQNRFRTRPVIMM